MMMMMMMIMMMIIMTMMMMMGRACLRFFSRATIRRTLRSMLCNFAGRHAL